MNATFVASIVGFIGSVVVVTMTYWLTKRREQEAEWRKEKLSYYKSFIESMSGILEGEDSPEGHKLFSKTTNNLLLFAPQAVVSALNAYRLELSLSNQNPSPEQREKLLTELLFAIRKDIGVYPADNLKIFKPMLWASGVNKIYDRNDSNP